MGLAPHEKGGAVPDWYTGAPFGLARPRGSSVCGRLCWDTGILFCVSAGKGSGTQCHVTQHRSTVDPTETAN